MLALDVAKYILATSKRGLSNLELQTILYTSELNCIRNNDFHLIDEDFEAWDFGAIIPEVYWYYRSSGANNIDKPKTRPQLNAEEKQAIDDAIEEFNETGYIKMLAKIKKSGGAWSVNYKEYEKRKMSTYDIKREALGSI